MLSRRRQVGEGQGGCIVGLIILLAAVFVAYKMIPIKVKAAELRQTVVDSAKLAGSLKDPAIERTILEKAKDLELPVSKEDLEIRRMGNSIRVQVDYVVPVEFPGYTYQWKFNHKAENPIF